jgi:hypothetical protein
MDDRQARSVLHRQRERFPLLGQERLAALDGRRVGRQPHDVRQPFYIENRL